MRAYAAAFTRRDDVLLVLRVNNFDADVDVARQIAALRLPADAPPIVVIYDHDIPVSPAARSGPVGERRPRPPHDSASSIDIFGCSKNRQNRIVENSTYPLDDFGFR